nr:uncharacterized protein LOC124810118 [Hydra vulgaris]
MYSYGETSRLSWQKQSIYRRPLILTNMDIVLTTAMIKSLTVSSSSSLLMIIKALMKIIIESESPVSNTSSLLLSENIDFVVEIVPTCEKSTLKTSVHSMSTECNDGNSIPGYVKRKVEKTLAFNNIKTIREITIKS